MNFNNDTDHFDQHFLVDNNTINKFIESANFCPQDIVVEVGPGTGNITRLIANKVKKLYCIELDTRLKPYLDEIANSNFNVEIIYESVLTANIPLCNKIITSLPYSIIEPFIAKLLNINFEELIMITGSKYADSVNNKEITYLSLLTNCFFDFEKIMDISPDCFKPKPRVMSSMVKLKPKKNNEGVYNFFKNMFLLDHKKIKNCLIESLIKTNICQTQRQAKEIIKEMNLDDDILETKFEVCSNNQLKILYDKVLKIYNDKN